MFCVVKRYLLLLLLPTLLGMLANKVVQASRFSQKLEEEENDPLLAETVRIAPCNSSPFCVITIHQQQQHQCGAVVRSLPSAIKALLLKRNGQPLLIPAGDSFVLLALRKEAPIFRAQTGRLPTRSQSDQRLFPGCIKKGGRPKEPKNIHTWSSTGFGVNEWGPDDLRG